ncbi:MAG: MBL fold metallo-hydrolase [Dehalococcoidia bacterium]|jgi:glyoxylase-like metal-dependent hydrolase (beta-lactamase superfamily II)|nr:MBL fold metallo-hydrolase [Dehalococcoidia bacterium]
MPQTRLSVGNVDILVLHDGELALPLDQTFPHVPAEAWAPYQRQYPESFNGTDNLRVHFECYLIRSQGRTILVDTGLGSNASNPGTVTSLAGGVDGRLMEEFGSAGLRTDDVDTVFLTHLHPDHVGWNLTPGSPTSAATFPRARYVAHQADWDMFKSPGDEESFGFKFWEETIGPLEELGVLDLLTGEHPLTSEVTAISTPGHTPGSMSLAIVSEDERALIMGDVFHGPAQVTETGWVFSFDSDPALAVQTRTRMVDRAEAENATLAICHHSGFGRVVRIEGRRYWQGV